ncbi:MAG: GntR family transcriptional regulator [Parvularcula sp.]|jgi:GntR family transcriptional regulator|nr:GntR family transcriptional regulator [Parvularcula sp.]
MPDHALTLTEDMLDDNSQTPLYQQVYDLIRAKIASGDLNQHARLPAEQDLSVQLGVSRITVKRALNELAAAGLVRRQRGLGTVVTYDASAPVIAGSFQTMIEGLARMGVDTKVQLLDCALAEASPAVREALDLPPGACVQRIVRLRHLGDAPLSYLVTHIPEDIAEKYEESALATDSLLSILERAGHAPVEAEQTISAAPAEAAMAVNLGVAQGAPLLKVHRIMREASGRPVQDITSHYRADRFEYRMRLNRDEALASGWIAKD